MSRFNYITKNAKPSFSKLANLYNKIPDTEGCMENLNSCSAWCCRLQCPQVLYCEFLRALDFILKNWEEEDFMKLFEKSLKHYLSKELIKGCIFWDKETKLCKIHRKRPFNCFVYGITPKEEFDERLKKIREKYKDEIAKFRDQCDLVKTKNGHEVTTEDTDKWWDELVDIEKYIGIDKKQINDESGGTYRTYHDHLLIFYLPDYLLENLSEVRQFGEVIEKQNVIETILNLVKSNL